MGRWPYLIAGIISGTLMIWAAVWGYAEAIIIIPRQNINHWEETGNINNPQAAAKVKSNLQKAIRLNSNNAEFYMDLARLTALQSNATQLSIQEKQHYQDQTIKNLKLALSKRPTWGLAWAKLAQAYAAKPNHTSEFIHALKRAIYFEPYEKLNQQHVIPLGIAHWNSLPETVKDKLKIVIQHALRYQPTIIKSIVSTTIHYNWANELSPLLKRKWHKNVLNKAIREKQAGEQI